MPKTRSNGQVKKNHKPQSDPLLEEVPLQGAVERLALHSWTPHETRQLLAWATDSRLNIERRQEVAKRNKRLNGNAYLANVIQQKIASHPAYMINPLPREDEPPPDQA